MTSSYMSISYHGIQEYSLRLLSEGRFQGLVYTKSVAETIFVQALRKATREAAIDVDRLAAALHSDGPPDKHKEAVRFVTPLVTRLVSLMQELSPSTGSSGEADELKRRREKMQSLGIHLTPRKRSAEELDPSDPASAKQPRTEPPTLPECLLAPYRPIQIQPEGHTETFVTQWVEKVTGKMAKAKASQFTEHLRKQDRATLQQAATQYGLDPSLVDKMANRTLTTMLAASQYLAA